MAADAETAVETAVSESEGDAIAVADSLRKYRFLARSSRQQKNFDVALAHYGQLLRYAPDDQKARYFSATILLRKNRRAEAKAAFRHSVRVDSTHFNTNLALTQIMLSEEQADSTWLFLQRVISAKPGVRKYLDFRRELADLLRKKGDLEKAVVHYTALSETPTDEAESAELYELLAGLREEQGDAGKALAWHAKLLALHEAANYAAKGDSAGVREFCRSLDRVVELQVQERDIAEACKTLRRLVALDPSNDYSYYHRMADLARQNGDSRTELVALVGMASADPRDLETVAVLVKFHMAADDENTAFEWVERGLVVEPRHSQLQLLKGDLLAASGAADDAIAAFEIARSDPAWEAVAQQRIWQLRPPETKEEKLKREFFGDDVARSSGEAN